MKICACHLGRFTVSSSLWASVTKPFVDIPLYLLMQNWKSACHSIRSKKKVMIDWLPSLVGLVKLNFDECSLSKP